MSSVEQIGLVLLSLALFLSVCLNFFLCIRRRRGKEDCCYPHTYDGEVQTQDEGFYFHNRRGEQESPRSRHEQQENPIYGNISSDVCYEMMTMRQKRENLKPLERDVNYASLDLKMANKRKKRHRNQQQNNNQDKQLVHLTPPVVNTFLDVDGDMDAHLPSKDTSTMVSHSSIYLNSQQIAQEAEEMERERSVNMEGWEGMSEDEGITREWEEGEEGRDSGNGAVCSQDNQSSIDHFLRSFSHDSDQQV